MRELTVVADFELLKQDRVLMYVENTHIRCIPFFTSFLTVPLKSGPACYVIQWLFRIQNFEASRTQI